MNKKVKQTAANSAFLFGVKKLMNKKVYARTLQLLNTPGGELLGGEKQAVTYLQQFFNKPVTAQTFIERGSRNA